MFSNVLRAVYSTLAPAGVNARLSTLIYHRVLEDPDPMLPDEPSGEEFEHRMRWVQRHFNVLSLIEAVERLQSGALPERALAITFDDGYANNERIAAPILKKLGLPATFFIATAYLDGGRMFNDSIVAALRDCPHRKLDLTEVGLENYSLESLEHRRRAVSAILPQIKALTPATRAAKAERICQLAEVSPTEDLMMTSLQVAALARGGFGIGAHTATHPILARLEASAAREEIHGGRQRLEHITGGPVRLFAYPNGRPHQDYTADTADLVRQLGFAAAFTTAPGVAGRDADLFQLPRFTPWDRSDMKFGIRMARNLMNASPIVEAARTPAKLGEHVR